MYFKKNFDFHMLICIVPFLVNSGSYSDIIREQGREGREMAIGREADAGHRVMD